MIVDLQRRLHECGRIRIGQQVPVGKTGKTRPTKLGTFRLTSPDKQRIINAANLYGGTPQQWQAPAGPQYEVITTTDRLNVVVPPSDLAFSQHYELWSGGGCLRRCDGRTATYSTDGAMIEGDCLCDPDNRECAVHTRLSVMLAELAGLGLWRLDTQGWNAALELQGAVDVLQLAAGRGVMLPAQLRLEQRMTKRPGQQTRRFAVPVLDVDITPAQLVGRPSAATPLAIGPVGGGLTPDKNGAGAPSASLTPVPDTVPQRPTPSIAEQVAPPPPRKRTGRSAAPIPATGLAPRTTTQVAAGGVFDGIDQYPDPQSPDPHQHPNPAEGQRPGHDPRTLPAESPDLCDPATRPNPDEAPMISKPQLVKLHILLKENELGDRDTGLAWLSEAVGHQLDSSKALTQAEAHQVIDILTAEEPDE
jgi:hypothetical protein